MEVKKGMTCKVTCCDKAPYTAEYDFDSPGALICDSIAYLRTECFRCILKDCAEALAKEDIYFKGDMI